MNYQEYIKPELLILIPVLYAIGTGIKRSNINDKYIPFILGTVGVLLSSGYIFGNTQIQGTQAVATAIFTAITQGILCAAASVYANEIAKHIKEKE